MTIEEYVNSKTRDERTKHIDLTTPCQDAYTSRSWKHIKIGDPTSSIEGQKVKAQANLKNYLNLSGKTSNKIHTCHLCKSNTKHGGKCVNPEHLYFGTVKENMNDMTPEERSERSRKGGYKTGKASAARNFTKEVRERSTRLGGKAAAKSPKGMNNQKNKCVHCGYVGNPGNVVQWHNDNCKHNPLSSRYKGVDI